ncbi:L10-interacting MYB domain-containing protein-like isoform X2 [Telopea speciosissima]|uniref:L10-interacting MYB domain-containing protein-like isoform X1 n=1 Tax=Telopea speciosissima TaxID=54955 RepID=UPI001CC6C536|nr:L10-interacting MYB domain-containing protein-like isoform X1 [Telopea speciosissima]XP_043699699.1 L10-interacting MYB domain-containing protein-like isoform X2 [Telopea speciosissima]
MDNGKGIEVGMKGDAKGPKESYCWSDERIKLLIDIAIDYSRKGYKLNTSFTKDGWAHLLREYNQKCEKQIAMQQLKNRWNILKAMWVAWVSLKNSGWTWNTALGTVDPPSKEHWDAYVKKHIHGKHFRHGPLRNEQELRELFYSIAADGEGAICTYEDHPLLPSPKGVTASNSAALNMDADDSSNDDVLPVEVLNMKKKTKQKSKRSIGSSSKRSKSDDYDDVGDTLKRILALEEQRRAKMIGGKKDTTLKEAVEILNSLEGIELGSNNHVLALEVLEDPTKREMFITMHESARIPWLLRAIQRKAREDLGSPI